MKSELKAKFLHYLSQKNKDQGFTLIELLVVIIIIGVLSAVALPNLLSQVGKARESEMKNAVGTVNRTQQAYHFERQEFGNSTDRLGVTLATEYITATTIASAADSATILVANTNSANDGTRAYAGGIEHESGEYLQVMCQSNEVTNTLAVADITNIDSDVDTAPDCNAANANAIR